MAIVRTAGMRVDQAVRESATQKLLGVRRQSCEKRRMRPVHLRASTGSGYCGEASQSEAGGKFSLGLTWAILWTVIALITTPLPAADGLVPGDLVRVTRSEMLLFKGQNFLRAPKGQEFILLKHDSAEHRVYLSFLKDDGTLVALTLPEDAVESNPPTAALDLRRGVEAFRDQRYDESKRLLARAAEDKQFAALAAAISTRLSTALNAAAQARNDTPAAKQNFAGAIEELRSAAGQLGKNGLQSLALPLDEGTDRLGGDVPPSKLDRADIAKRVADSDRSLMQCRQAMGLRRLFAASRHIEVGLLAEPARPELTALQVRVKRDIEDAESLYTTANKMRRFEAGVVHALSAIDDGLKLCSDHVRLRELRKELSGAFEERTSPPVTPAFLAAARVSTSRELLEEGRRLYTNRCTECHELEMLDSRSRASWDKAVTGMSRRANLTAAEKAQIMDYIAAALVTVESKASR
jgi:hypothetical protein